jgi:hypothetical protein
MTIGRPVDGVAQREPPELGIDFCAFRVRAAATAYEKAGVSVKNDNLARLR